MTITDTPVRSIDHLRTAHTDLGQAIDHLAAHADQLANRSPVYSPKLAVTSNERDGHDIWMMCADADDLAAMTRMLKDGAPLGTVRIERDDTIDVTRDFGSCTLRVWITRRNVCERKVVGTESVQVPDPDAPLVTVERDIVEWDCHPILADDLDRIEREGEWT